MIDKKIQEELHRKFNPEGSELRRLQLRMLEILKFVDQICKENNLCYWLSSGTCLGAVRHGGFIPWDDDLDIEMPGEDYDKFVKIMNELKDAPYILQTHSNEPSYIFPFGKVRDLKSEIIEDDSTDKDYKYKGIFIDIFPMDPSNSKKIFELAKNMYLGCWATNKISNPLLKRLLKNSSYALFFRVLIPFLRMFQPKKSALLRQRLGSCFPKPRKVSEIFPLSKINFEGFQFSCPGNTHNYLTALYGNYMEIPDIRDTHIHATSFRFLNKED